MALSNDQLKQIVVEVLTEVYGYINPKVEHAIESALSAEAWTNMLIRNSVEKLEIEAPEMIRLGLQQKIDGYDPRSIILDVSESLVETVRQSVYELVLKRINLETDAFIGVVEAKQKSGILTFQNKDNEIYHEKFAEFRALVQANIPILLVGPTGSGKGYTAGQVAASLGIEYRFDSGVAERFQILGYKDTNGIYVPSNFFLSFTTGGMFNLDEVDTSDPVALTVVNEGLDKGLMSFPHGIFKANHNYRTMATANTWGSGSDSEYVGRFKLDAATLNRFYKIYFGYSTAVEERVCPDREILEFIWRLRQAADELGIKIIISTRTIKYFYIAMSVGLTPEQAIRGLITEGQNVDSINKMIERVKEDGSDIQKNQYFSTLRAMNLVRCIGSRNV